MVEIGGRPILWHIMKLYERHGITDFNLALGYKGEVAVLRHVMSGKSGEYYLNPER